MLLDAPEAISATVAVSHLGDRVTRMSVELAAGRTRVSLGQLPAGAYGVLLNTAAASVTTAVEVLDGRVARPRYGFLARFEPGRSDVEDVIDSLRAFHLTLVQFYDWMYRHARLLPPPQSLTETGEFEDALGRRQSLDTVRRLVGAVHEAGASAIGYAAVYGAGDDYALEHPDQVLHHRDGTPWGLADFLTIMDVRPGSGWTRHIVAEMAQAVREVPFDGLHLDQYGNPKVALSATGETVDLAQALPAFVDVVRSALPEATLIFNNVNDFPTRQSARADQDVTYIEVWPPHETYADLVELVGRAQAAAPGRPVVLAAYLAPYADQSGRPELAAATLALSTVWAAGGQYLLFGEDSAVLVDPYYPRHTVLPQEAVTTLRRYADFSVALGDVLFDPQADEITGGVVGGDDDDVVVDGVQLSHRPRSGAVWVRVSRLPEGRLVVQLVDYRDQSDGRWNAPRTKPAQLDTVVLRVRVVSVRPRVRFGTPADGPVLRDLDLADKGDTVRVAVPPFDTWAVLLVDR